MTRPLTRFVGDVFSRAMPRGFAAGTARYGLLLSHLETRTVHGFVYAQPVPFGAPPGAKGPPPRPLLWLVTRLHPGIRKRIQTSHAAIENKLWREDLNAWDRDLKPAAIRAHRALEVVDPEQLETAALAEHLRACESHLDRMVEQHHRLNVACMLPLGDFLAHVQEWTGKPTGEILLALRGASPISRGAAIGELRALADAIRHAPEARRVFESSGEPREVLDALRRRGGPVGEALQAYLSSIGLRSLGFDVSEPHILEMPEILVRAIRSAVDDDVSPPGDPTSPAQIASLRDAVPDAHRATFDALFEEARLLYRLRDERGMFSDAWALGLARRAIVAAGKRAATIGSIEAPGLFIDASHDEMQDLLRGERSVASNELRERARWRTTRTTADAPVTLGGTPAPPPPADLLPPRARRAARALGIVMTAMFDPPSSTGGHMVRGMAVSGGVYEGSARLVQSDGDFARIEKGDVLVTRATAAYFNVVLPLLGGIVTDRGGQLSHAAIVAREYGIPAVVGTRDATTRIKDGARVRVDGSRGEVEILS